MPAIAKILIVFAAMLLLTRLRLQLGVAIAVGGVALCLWGGVGIAATMRGLVAAVIGVEFWLFVVVVALIIEIGRYVTRGANADEIVAAASRWGGRHGRAATLMVLPAVIGLIPMPGGALFSAPFVERTGGGGGRAAWKSTVNYWFRHVWEYWWPLYPGVIVTMQEFEMIKAWQFMAVQMVFTPVAIGAGYLLLVRPRLDRLAVGADIPAGNGRRAAFLFLPLLIVVLALVLAPLVLRPLFPEMAGKRQKLIGMLLGLVAGMFILWRDERKARSVPDAEAHGERLFSVLLGKKSLNVLFTLMGVLVFKSLLETSQLLPVAARELVDSGIPVVLAVMMLPLLAGFVTGLALGFAGAAFPLVVGLMMSGAPGLTPLATLVLAYGFGYMGMMLSPVHLCLLVTRDFFSASVWGIYRRLWPCAAVLLVYSLAAYYVLRLLGW